MDALKKIQEKISLTNDELLKKWLLEGFSAEEPISFFDFLPGRSSVESELYEYAKKLPLSLYEKLKDVIIKAISEWQLLRHGYQCLISLTALAAYTKASGAINELRVIIYREFNGYQIAKDQVQVISELLYYLSAFIPNRNLHDLWEFLFNTFLEQGKNEKQLTGQLFVYICHSEPNRLPIHLHKFLSYTNEIGQEAAPFYVQLVRFVGINKLLELILEISPKEVDQFISGLFKQEWSPARLESISNEIYVKYPQGSENLYKTFGLMKNKLLPHAPIPPIPAPEEIESWLYSISLRN